MILDSKFLIDLQRELDRRRPAGAHTFLAKNEDVRRSLALISEGEFACGIGDDHQHAVAAFLRQHPILRYTSETAWIYSRIQRQLKRQVQLIGTNDLWVAATAVAHGLPVVACNADDFRRVPRLTVYQY